MYKSMCTKVTALPASTVETQVDTIKVPSGAKRIIGVGCTFLAGGLGLTTLQNVSGKLTLKSPGMTSKWVGDQQFLTGVVSPLTSGVAALPPYIHPTNIDVIENIDVEVYATADEADTIVPGVRAQLIFSD